MSPRARHRGLHLLAVALCAEIVLVVVQRGGQAVMTRLGVMPPTLVFLAIGMVDFLIVLASLVALVLIARDEKPAARVAGAAAVVAACCLLQSLAQAALHLSFDVRASAVHGTTSAAATILCWLVLVAVTKARGRRAPLALTLVFALAVAARLASVLAFASLLPESCQLAAIAGEFACIAGVVAMAAQLALVIPLARD